MVAIQESPISHNPNRSIDHIKSIVEDLSIITEFQLLRQEQDFEIWTEFKAEHSIIVNELLKLSKDNFPANPSLLSQWMKGRGVVPRTWENSEIHTKEEFLDTINLIENKIASNHFSESDLKVLQRNLSIVSNFFSEKIEERHKLFIAFKEIKTLLEQNGNEISSQQLLNLNFIESFIYKTLNGSMSSDVIANLITQLNIVRIKINSEKEKDTTPLKKLGKNTVLGRKSQRSSRPPYRKLIKF